MSLAIIIPASLITMSITSILYYILPNNTTMHTQKNITKLTVDIQLFDKTKLKHVTRTSRKSPGLSTNESLMFAISNRMNEIRAVSDPML